jgi:hypothetical protein
MSKILFSTYTIKLRDKRSDAYYNLADINGGDLINLFKDFLKHIESSPMSEIDYTSKDLTTKLTLRLGKDLSFSPEKRTIYGRFESGVSGKPGVISDIEENSDFFKMLAKHARMQALYFFIEVPKNSKVAFLILQRESSYGIKGLFYTCFRKFLNQAGYDKYFFELNNLLLPKVLKGMLKNGKVKKVTLFNKEVPAELDDIIDNGFDLKTLNMSSKTVISNSKGIPITGLIEKCFYQNTLNSVSEIDSSQERYHDISFVIKDGNKEKTYHLKKEGKTLPDLDISDRVTYKDSVPEISSLTEIATTEIEDMKNSLKIKSYVSEG